LFVGTAVEEVSDEHGYMSNRGRFGQAAKLEFFCWVLFALTALAFPSILHPQSKSTTAALSGTVSDPSGARIPNATVKLTNPENGVTRAGTTSASGEFSFALLVQGTYTLEVSAPGFTTIRQDKIVLTAGDTVAETVTLTIGST